MSERKPDNPEEMRLDKWLWCARFFKTRSLAADAIKAGKIQVNDIRIKPAKTITPGDRIIIKRTPYLYEVTIKSLTKNRKSASEATQLYEERPESILARQQLSEQLKINAQMFPQSKRRPSKRDRRQIIRFKNVRSKE